MIRTQFISNYKGESDYRVDGLPGRVHVRACSPSAQAFYTPIIDPQLIGTVTMDGGAVPDEVFEHFNASQSRLRADAPHLFVPSLVKAKWYRELGWVRCEP
ncbi:MAG: hypothetical protein AzoDbin1_05238 [Azoarcus sp.]|nr:hypothetical protein [Azoarcus sp.]